MISKRILAASFLALVVALATPGDGACRSTAAPNDSTYAQLESLFADWRRFQIPPRVDEVFDYLPSAMARQHRQLKEYFSRLSRIDTTGWTISQRIDYHLVLAEMYGLDFDHRVRKPWARDPAFYVMVFPSQTDVVPREGPVIPNAIELWQYSQPFTAEAIEELADRLLKIPIQLDVATRALTGNARDLWLAGTARMEQQLDHLTRFADEIGDSSLRLASAVSEAIIGTRFFVRWLKEQSVRKTGPSGIGAANYTWYLQKVHLVPHSWQEQVTLVDRELARSHAALRLEEHRNRHLSPLEPISSEEEYDQRMRDAVDSYIEFLDEQAILTVEDYMRDALMARIGTFSPSDGPRSFFSEVNYREPLIMRTHHHHWIDIARMSESPHPSPIRSTPLLSNIFDSRAEGLATGMEEMMMHAGLFDDEPRTRELVWIMLAQRAARALAALRMHANEYTMQEAMDFASRWTPRGWLPADGSLVRREQHLYLQQPGYGTSYVVGKLDIEHLLADYAREKGSEFQLRNFMDELSAAGVIPVSLIRWEVTGQDDEIRMIHGK
ncbi:MAG: DUF885 domain-containing protein [Rhodothermia bacterium]|nr:DUF885 domain-containing protein [Rhodothermia bacterium]